MNTCVWFDGLHSFVKPGMQVKHGDEPLVISFDRPADSMWDEEKYFCFDVKVDQYSDAKVFAAFYPAVGEPLKIQYELLPNMWQAFRVQLDELWSRRYFLPVFPGAYKSGCTGHPTDPQTIVRVVIGVIPGKDFKNAQLGKVYVSDEQPEFHPPMEPMIDEMGQLIGFEWPTKTHSVEEMAERLKAEYKAALETEARNRGLSSYGGYLCKKFDATGWFHTHHDGKRWWLVDPEGYAFFSHGVCYGTRMGEFGWYTGMESFYTNPPKPDDPLYKGAFTQPKYIAEYVKRHGETEHSNDWMFNPARANMMRVFGEEWWDAWRTITTRRFKDWGLNTTGIGIVNFIDERMEDFLSMSKLPYVVTLKRFPVTSNFIFRDFPDVFSEEYEANSATFANNELKPMANDPCLIGYFLHNEPEWLFQSDCNIAYELMVKNEKLESRKHMMQWLMDRYQTIESLNAAWGTSFENFEVFLAPVSRSVQLSEEAWAVLREYEQILVVAFAQIPMNACRKVDEHHLCLGLRYSSMQEKVVEVSKIFDVLSFNCYQRSAIPKLDMALPLNKPAIIGEWHFGGQEIGLLRTALISCTTQEERAKAYKAYLQEAAAHPMCVGAHYFEYNDQTLMGRFDGEHMAHGIIDCTNKPYPPLAKAISETSDVLYDVLTGEKKAFSAEIEWLEPKW
ncbi:MAG: beta-galactosidase [Clostridia bacterium]|nr:beta-galactosidase [Clostridia bacterium]